MEKQLYHMYFCFTPIFSEDQALDKNEYYCGVERGPLMDLLGKHLRPEIRLKGGFISYYHIIIICLFIYLILRVD